MCRYAGKSLFETPKKMERTPREPSGASAPGGSVTCGMAAMRQRRSE
jgi:hypothetical protein